MLALALMASGCNATTGYYSPADAKGTDEYPIAATLTIGPDWSCHVYIPLRDGAYIYFYDTNGSRCQAMQHGAHFTNGPKAVRK